MENRIGKRVIDAIGENAFGFKKLFNCLPKKTQEDIEGLINRVAIEETKKHLLYEGFKIIKSDN